MISFISRFPLKTVHPFRNFLTVLPPPTLYKAETRKKFWINASNIVCGGEGRGWTCVNWKTHQKRKSIPRLLSMIVENEDLQPIKRWPRKRRPLYIRIYVILSTAKFLTGHFHFFGCEWKYMSLKRWMTLWKRSRIVWAKDCSWNIEESLLHHHTWSKDPRRLLCRIALRELLNHFAIPKVLTWL